MIQAAALANPGLPVATSGGMRRTTGFLSLLLAPLLGVSVGACGDDAAAPEEGPAVAAEEGTPETAPPEATFDADGNLLPSDVVVAGLTLPRGLELAYEEERTHVYRTEAAIGRVQAYFGTRLVTGQVDRVGEGAIFREAVPRGVRGGVVKMDVSILALGRGRVRVEIVELPPPPQNPPNEVEIRRQLQEDMARWD